MRVNVLSPGFYKSGGLLTIYEYSNRLVENGHSVTLYIPKKIYNLQVGKFQPVEMMRRIARRLRTDRERYISELQNYKFEIRIVPSLNNKFIDDADITIATAWPTAFDLYKMEKSKGTKIYFIQDYEIWDSNIKYVDKSYSLPLYRITVSNYLKELLRNKFNSNSEFVLNSINFNHFNNTNKVFNENTVILFIYSRAGRKNIKMLLKSIEHIHRKYPNVIFKSFGFEKNPDISDYVEYYENPSLEKRIKLYCTSDIFLLSSSFEGFGLPPAEAMACKCAVISTNVGALPEFSENNISSILVSPDDDSAFTESIEHLIVNKEELQRISLNGYNSVREKLNYEVSVKKFEELLLKWCIK